MSFDTDSLELDYILHHLGEDRKHLSQPGSPPLYLTSMFTFPTVDAMRNTLTCESSLPFYTRGTNPTLSLLADKLAALEGGEAALLFASGSAAIAAAVCAQVQAGDHIVCVDHPYSWTSKLIKQFLGRYGVSATFWTGEVSDLAAAVQPNTKLVYLESPNSFTFEIQDIEAICRFARENNLVTIVDNSYCSPLFQNPIKLGADIVVHSATKYLSGHSDALGGALICSQPMREKIFQSEYMTLGGTMSPMNAWLILRGLRTLELRMLRSHENGMAIAQFLDKHPAVKKVNYPFLESSATYHLAAKQMKGCGGLMSFELNTTELNKIETFCNHLKYFHLGCSWGSFESLCFPAATLYTSANYSQTHLPVNLIRIYCGLEHFETLKQDLEQALFLSGI